MKIMDMNATKMSVLNKLSNVFKIYKPECTKTVKIQKENF